ncbi:MAG: hypothetical protein IT371_30690 [Deltaproteobacteria bacterium]|nr:hypothetical protein [Deltaproteobacteria bacterium]
MKIKLEWADGMAGLEDAENRLLYVNGTQKPASEIVAGDVVQIPELHGSFLITTVTTLPES